MRADNNSTSRRSALEESAYARYRSILMAFFLRRLGSYADAEDLTHEALARLAAIGQEHVSNGESYLFQMASNLLRDGYRRERVRAAYSQDVKSDYSLVVEYKTADRELIGREAVTRVSTILENLPERTRNIFILYRLDGVSRKDIAAAYGISVSAVEKHISKAALALLVVRSADR